MTTPKTPDPPAHRCQKCGASMRCESCRSVALPPAREGRSRLRWINPPGAPKDEKAEGDGA